MRGFTLPLVRTYIRSPNSRPPVVDSMKAHRPSTTMEMVWGVRKVLAVALKPTDRPRGMVTMFIRPF